MKLIDGMNGGFGQYRASNNPIMTIDPTPFIDAFAAKGKAYAQASVNDAEIESKVLNWEGDIPDKILHESAYRMEGNISTAISGLKKIFEDNGGDVAYAMKNDPKAKALMSKLSVSKQITLAEQEKYAQNAEFEKNMNLKNGAYKNQIAFEGNTLNPYATGDGGSYSNVGLQKVRRGLLKGQHNIDLHNTPTMKNTEDVNDKIKKSFEGLGNYKEVLDKMGVVTSGLSGNQILAKFRETTGSNEIQIAHAELLAADAMDDQDRQALGSDLINEKSKGHYYSEDKEGNMFWDNARLEADVLEKGIEVIKRHGNKNTEGEEGLTFSPIRDTDLNAISKSKKEPEITPLEGAEGNGVSKAVMVNGKMQVGNNFGILPKDQQTILGRKASDFGVHSVNNGNEIEDVFTAVPVGELMMPTFDFSGTIINQDFLSRKGAEVIEMSNRLTKVSYDTDNPNASYDGAGTYASGVMRIDARNLSKGEMMIDVWTYKDTFMSKDDMVDQMIRNKDYNQLEVNARAAILNIAAEHRKNDKSLSEEGALALAINQNISAFSADKKKMDVLSDEVRNSNRVSSSNITNKKTRDHIQSDENFYDMDYFEGDYIYLKMAGNVTSAASNASFNESGKPVGEFATATRAFGKNLGVQEGTGDVTADPSEVKSINN
jgi:hypothetical protein